MKLFLVERTDTIGFDEFESHVVSAKDEVEAKQESLFGACPVKVKEIGTTKLKKGIIHSSFRAG